MSGPSVRIHLPPASLFGVPPSPYPYTLPPPEEQRSFAAPFGIDRAFYNGALDWKVPATIGSIYAITVMLLNKWNRSRGNKAWWISTTTVFHVFVIAHNIILAVFSALVMWGMMRALAHTWPGNHEYELFGKMWPGLRTKNGLAGAADAMCKIHGPRGFGDAAYYNAAARVWENKNKLMVLAANGSPDPTDVGRLWNEGLAFWGFWFYLSKFYEVLDTFIIVAKGKRSSTLQTYHHTGAMLCMWAGIRFMSPPIWMFVWINSTIHTMMVCYRLIFNDPVGPDFCQYTYYTFAALGVQVPQRIKRTLTTLQILQFLIGFTFAAGHLFVEYSVPVTMPYTVTSTITSIVSAASSAVSQAATEASSIAAGATPVAAWLKKLAFRAAGEEGLAENVLNEAGAIFGPETEAHEDIIETIQRQVTHRTHYETIPCIDTQGEAFAIYLNLLYLLPLTFLFVRFFVKSYTHRGDPKAKHATHRRRLSKAAEDAAHGVNRELDSLGKSAEDGVGEFVEGLRRTASGSRRTPSPGTARDGASTPRSADKRRVSATIERLGKRFEEAGEAAVEDANEGVQKVKSNGSAAAAAAAVVRKKVSEGHERLRKAWEEGMASQGPAEAAGEAAARAKDGAGGAMEAVRELVQTPADEVVSKLADAAEAAVSRAKQAVSGDVKGEQAGAGAEEQKSVVDGLSESAKQAVKGSEAKSAEEGKQAANDEKATTTPSNGSRSVETSTPGLGKDESKGTDASWEDIRASQASLKREDSAASGKENEKPAESTPLARTQSNDRGSPDKHKSRIPRPKDSSRSRSPVKKANGARAGSATPGLSSRMNGASTPIKEEKETDEARADSVHGADERDREGEERARQHDAAHPLGTGEGEESFAGVVKEESTEGGTEKEKKDDEKGES